MLLRINIGHKLVVKRRVRARGQALAGGWAWQVTCCCGWRSWKRGTEDQALIEFDVHIIETPGAIRIESVRYWTSMLGETFAQSRDLALI